MTTPQHPAGQFLGIDIPGPHLDDETRSYLERYRFGGVCLFRKNVQSREQVARLVRDIREVLGPQAWISIDQEGGAVLRTEDLPAAPSAMALGAVDDPALAEAVGNAVGRGLVSMGVNWDYAPCLDVNIDPRNPVIGDRSFGGDPHRVAELGLAWARGLQRAGVIATAKHFPGHGDTYLDSHLALPRVDKPRTMLERVELYPFRKAVEAGIPAIMTAHIVYSQLDPLNPATLSKTILTGLLREEWGFGGVIVTDSMGMKAIADNFPDGQAAVRSVQAGADIVLALGSWETKLRQAEAVAKAVETGELSGPRVEESLARLQRLVQRFPGTPRVYPAEAERADFALMEEAARRSITTYGPV
ncbi:MAG: beta-N-acetylhexosaminidase, partial [Meiothermus sp.]